MNRTFVISFAKAGINMQDYRDELITAVKHARLNLESRFWIDFQYMEFSETGSVSILDFASHRVIASKDPRDLYDHLVKFIKEDSNEIW